MEVLKTEDSDHLTFIKSAPIQAELDYWERLIFSFDMDRDPTNSSGNKNTRKSRSTTQMPTASTSPHDGSSRLTNQDQDILVQFAAGNMAQRGGIPHDSYDVLSQTLPGMQQGYNPYIPPAASFPPNVMPQGNIGQQHMQMPPQDYSWDPRSMSHHPQGQYDPLQHTHHYDPSVSQFTYGVLSQQQPLHVNTNTSPPARTSTSQTPDPVSPNLSPSDTTTESISATEDKRRRNTAASARFRNKKKQRSLNLERSVSDLTGRAEELEREASELRRENGWLKEIVMLKGRNIAETSRSGGNQGDDDMDSDSDESDDTQKKKRRKDKDK